MINTKIIQQQVNGFISANTHMPPAQLAEYFKMYYAAGRTALEMLERLNSLDFNHMVKVELLYEKEAEVLHNAVRYILKHSHDLQKDFDIIEKSGLLSIEQELRDGDLASANRYTVLMGVGSVLDAADDYYQRNRSPWQHFVQLINPSNYFTDAFHAAVEFDDRALKPTPIIPAEA